jgi:para-nitrobenzyl esterase
VFKGIPFAASAAGEGRWREPAPRAPWTGVLKADHYAPSCFQKPPVPGAPQNNLNIIGAVDTDTPESEDCLYLNLWTPAKTTDAKLPVMVWIYGTGFNYGYLANETFNGVNLAKKGVIVVTIPYRINIFGFFAHPELSKESPHHASGNYGILDQIAALKWVKANIAAFGGDPDNVTVFGESTGSGSVSILQASPLAKGLFVRAMGESTSRLDGGGDGAGHSLAQGEKEGVDFAKSVGAQTVADLRKMPARELASKTPRMEPVEKDNYVLPGEVYDLYAAGKQNDVPVLVGSNGEEGKILHHVVKPETEAEKKAFQSLYGNTDDPVRFSTTDWVEWQAVAWATLSQAKSKKPAYVYYFRVNPPPRPGPVFSVPAETVSAGPVHGSEIIYVFNNLQTRNSVWTDADRRVADVMSSYWTNFAKTGDPNGPGLPRWPQFEPTNPKVMEFSNTAIAAPVPLPHQEGVRFMDGYFARLRAARGGTQANSGP